MKLHSKDGEGYAKRKGHFGSKVSAQALTCVAPLNRGRADFVITGTVTGLLLLWQDRNCVEHVKAHHGTINGICLTPSGFATGGKDKRIRLWSARLEPRATFDLSLFGSCPSVRSLDLSQDGSSMVVGMRGGEIYEVRKYLCLPWIT